MKDMKTVGLIMANPLSNYGAHLQAFATQYAIDKLGVNTEIIERSPKLRKFKYSDWRIIFYFWRIKFNKKKKESIKYDAEFQKLRKDRAICAKEFRESRLHNIRSFQSYEELVERAKSYSAVLIGSDQMWPPGAAFENTGSLRFVPEGVDRISYATSLGVSYYPRYCWKSSREMWKNIDFLSVREEQGAEIIRKVCNNDINVKVVADPTYLLTKEEWEKTIPVKKMCDKKYVFCYFLGNDEQSKLCAKRYAEKHNLHLVSILSCESYSDIDRTFADENVGAVSPEDFINWVRGAEVVFTDSFHGLAFSVINHKQFFVFYRYKSNSKGSRNSRINNILKMWDCTNRLIEDPEINWDNTNIPSIDYDVVEELVSAKREDSLQYLKTALRINEQ